MKLNSTALLTALTLSALSLTLRAQDGAAPTPAVDGGGAPPAGGDRGDRRGGWGGNPEQFRQRMSEALKGRLKASDEEFAVIQPLVEKVFTKQREARGGFGGGFGGRGPRGGGPGGPGGPGGDNAGDQGGNDRGGRRGGRGGDTAESQALGDALRDDNTPASDIAAKLTALREQRKKAAAELASAREDLKKVLTVRQEAVLVQMGMLE